PILLLDAPRIDNYSLQAGGANSSERVRYAIQRRDSSRGRRDHGIRGIATGDGPTASAPRIERRPSRRRPTRRKDAAVRREGVFGYSLCCAASQGSSLARA